MSSSKTLYLLCSTGSIQEDREKCHFMTESVDWDIKADKASTKIINSFMHMFNVSTL